MKGNELQLKLLTIECFLQGGNLFIISPWLILCTFFAALFLASGKRHSDILFLGKKAKAHKESLAFYTKEITNTLMIITTTLLIASYCFYAVLSEHKYLVLSIPFALSI